MTGEFFADGRPLIHVETHPEPTEEELLAILQALGELDSRESGPDLPGTDESGWQKSARMEVIRGSDWPIQFRSWSERRR